MLSFHFFFFSASLIFEPDYSNSLPSDCSTARQYNDSKIELIAYKGKCIFTKPGFFFGNNLIIEIYWQENNSTGNFSHLGPSKNGCIVNVQATYIYAILLSPISQTVHIYPTQALSRTYKTYTGAVVTYNIYFSTKNITEYKINTSYDAGNEDPTFVYNNLLVLGNNVRITKSSSSSLNKDSKRSLLATIPFISANESGMSYIALGRLPLMVSRAGSYLFENVVDVTLEQIEGIPCVSGMIPYSPSIASLKDIDPSYQEPPDNDTVSKDPSSPKTPKPTPTHVNYILISAICFAVAIVIVIVVLVIFIKRKRDKKIEEASQHSSDSSYYDYYSYDSENSSIPYTSGNPTSLDARKNSYLSDSKDVEPILSHSDINDQNMNSTSSKIDRTASQTNT